MIDFFGTVEDGEVDTTVPMPADDAQAVEEISAEELLENLTGEDSAQTAANEGDGDPGVQTEPAQANNQQQEENDKFSRRIAAALKSQKQQIFGDLGMSETEVRELIRAHQAEKMHREDPEISPKAAQEILKLREQTRQSANPQVEAYKADINSLIAEGWTKEQLVEFTSDDGVKENLRDGMSVRQAAWAYLRSNGGQTQQNKKTAVPTVRTATASPPPDEDRIANMSDKEFDAFQKRIRDAMYSGKKVTFR